jgi:acid phosphatase family membrane protein YuiD
MLAGLLSNKVLYASLTAWLLAQIIKVPIDYLLTRKWHWALLLQAGGFPSSHTSLVVSTCVSTGLYAGFDSAVFAVSLAVAMIISYDASGVRRQAGLQAVKINTIINELLQGHPISEKQLQEVLGHTHRQVLGGVVLGISISVLFWFLFPPA